MKMALWRMDYVALLPAEAPPLLHSHPPQVPHSISLGRPIATGGLPLFCPMHTYSVHEKLLEAFEGLLLIEPITVSIWGSEI